MKNPCQNICRNIRHLWPYYSKNGVGVFEMIEHFNLDSGLSFAYRDCVLILKKKIILLGTLMAVGASFALIAHELEAHAQEKKKIPVVSAKGFKFRWSKRASLTSDACTPPPRCKIVGLGENLYLRNQFDPWFIEAGNKFKVRPSILKSLAHIESLMDPTRGNSAGRGLLAISDDNRDRSEQTCSLSNALFTPSIHSAISMTNAVVSTNGSMKFPVWSPRGQALYTAEQMQTNLTVPEGNFYIYDYDSSGREVRIKVSDILNALVYKGSSDGNINWIRAARFAAGMHNKGAPLVEIAFKRYYELNHKLPSDFGQAWEVFADEGQRPHDLSEKSWETGKCYVWKVAGLCGDSQMNLYQRYESDFQWNRDKNHWESTLK